jgi:DNA-binding transcriptional ArsR family regulator
MIASFETLFCRFFEMRKDHRIVAGFQREDEIDVRLVRALSHPVRLRILKILNEREASPNELKDLLDHPLGNVAYHARVLEKCGCIRQVRTARRRGAIEHYFRAVPRSYIGHQDLRRVPPSVRAAFSGASVQTFVNRIAAALEAGTIDRRPDTTLTWVTVALDQEGWVEVAEILADALAQVETVHDRCETRAVSSGEAPMAVVVGLAAFEAAGPDRPQA